MGTTTWLLLGAAAVGGYLLVTSANNAASSSSTSPSAAPPALTAPSDLVARMLNGYNAWRAANGYLRPDRSTWITIMRSSVDPRLSAAGWGYVYDQGVGYASPNSPTAGHYGDEAKYEQWFNDAAKFYPS